MAPFAYGHSWSMYLQSEKASETFLDMWLSIFVSSMAAIWQSIFCDECFGWLWQNLSPVSEICAGAIFILSTVRTTKFGSMIPNILCSKLSYFDIDQTWVDWTQSTNNICNTVPALRYTLEKLWKPTVGVAGFSCNTDIPMVADISGLNIVSYLRYNFQTQDSSRRGEVWYS
jgi:hypothetical protein